MANYFNATYYFAAKAKQLSTTEKTWTAAEVQAEFAKQGINAEDHYKAYGASEGLSPNAYFNEKEYLASKLAALQDNDPTWANKTVADLQAEFKALGINAADHYEQYGAFETRKDGTLLNPSNAFDANAYFAAKLAQLQKIGFEGADTMTVADVVKAVQEAGISPVAHLQAYGATEAKADGIPLVQTVPVAQRVANDPARVANGELVPGNYNQPTKGPAAAVAAPVTKPADVGGLSATAPKLPSEPVKTPADAGFVAPPASLVDGPNDTIIPPTGTTGTGPNNSFIVVGSDGKGTVVNKDGTIQGTIDKVETDSNGNFVQPPLDVVIKDANGNNTNDKPADNTGNPVEPTPPTVDPEPENPVDPPAPAPTELTFVPDDSDPTITTLTLTQKDDVTFTIDDTGALKFKPAGGLEKTLDAEMLNVKIGANVNLIGKGADFVTFLANNGTARTIVKSTDAGKIEITDAKSGESYVGIHADLNVTAKVAAGTFAYDNTNHGTVDTFEVADKATLTAANSTLLSGKKLDGAGTFELNAGAETVSGGVTIDASAMTAGLVDATFTENSTGADANVLNYTGGKNVDKLTLTNTDGSGSYTNMHAVINLGSGDDMLVLNGKSGSSFAFANDAAGSGSVFNGGEDTDTLKVTSTNGFEAADLVTLNTKFGASGDKGFEHLLLDNSGSASTLNLASGGKFTAIGFGGSGAYTLSSVSATQSLFVTDTDVTLNITSHAATAAADKVVNLDFVDFGKASHKATVVLTADAIDSGSFTATGSDKADELILTAGSGDFAQFALTANMGSGDDTLTIDLANNTSGSITFGSGSAFNGGDGSADTLAVSGGLGGALAIDFTNLTLTEVEKLDLSAVTGTNDLTLTFSGGNTLAVSGSTAGATIMNMGDGNDAITFSGAEALTIDTGKGADSVIITNGAKTDTIILNSADSGTFADFDTITGFTAGSGGTKDILEVSSHVTKPASLTDITSAAATVVSDNAIYRVEATFADAQVEDAATAFTALFDDNASKYFKATQYSEQTKAVVVVQGTTDSFVFYIDSAADGDATDFTAEDIAYVAKVADISGSSTDFDIANFA